MGRKNRRRGARELDADLIAEILSENGTPSVSGGDAATSIGDGGFERKETAADRAYTHAVEVCDRIVAELDAQLPQSAKRTAPSEMEP